MKDANGIKEFYKNGRIEWDIPFKPGTYPPGVRHGVAKQYHPNGQLKLERTYVDGVVQGIEKIWLPNGAPAYETAYKDGKKNGIAYVWFPGGGLELEVNWKDDVKHGLFRRFDKNGIVVFQREYIDGQE